MQLRRAVPEQDLHLAAKANSFLRLVPDPDDAGKDENRGLLPYSDMVTETGAWFGRLLGCH